MDRLKQLAAKVPAAWRAANPRRPWWEFLDEADQAELARLMEDVFKG